MKKLIGSTYRAFQTVVFNSGQKMALRGFYFIRALTKAIKYYYIDRSQRHLLIAIENNRFGGPIGHWNPKITIDFKSLYSKEFYV